jgi:hypothetical protein
MLRLLPFQASQACLLSSGGHMISGDSHLLLRSGFPSMGNEPIPIGESPAATPHRWPTTRETGVEGPTKEPSPLPRPPAASFVDFLQRSSRPARVVAPSPIPAHP